jgi:hypothetical protein
LNYYQTSENAFPLDYLSQLQGQILNCPYFAVNNLNRDFIGTKGFSLVFQRSGLNKIEQQFPFLKTYLSIALESNVTPFISILCYSKPVPVLILILTVVCALIVKLLSHQPWSAFSIFKFQRLSTVGN